MSGSFQKLTLVILSTCITLGCLELGIRQYDSITRSIPFWKNPPDSYQNILGWNGKQVFGQTNTDKFKIMIIGDSFTDGNGESEENIYYSQLKQAFDAELFIYGGAGYGTLQEYIVLDKYIDEVNPDLIIIQLTSNDFINNDYALEKKSYFNNNLSLRPYYENGVIRLDYPTYLGNLRYQLQLHSRLAMHMFASIDSFMANLASKNVIRSIEDDIDDSNGMLNEYITATLTTTHLFKKMMYRAGNIPTVFIPVDTKEPYFSTFRKLISSANGIWIENPAIEITSLIEKKEDVQQSDGGHWNSLGHYYFGKALVNSLKDKKVLIDKIH